MVITVTFMHMMQAPTYDVINVVEVWHSLVPALWSMNMFPTVIKRDTIIRIGFTHFDDMFIAMILMGMVKMPVMKIINVAIMTNGGMSTIRPMNMFGMRMSI